MAKKTHFEDFDQKVVPDGHFGLRRMAIFLGATKTILEQTHTRTLPSGLKKIARQPKAYTK